MKHLDKILDYKRCDKITEKRFSKEFFEKFNIKKYKFLFEDYDYISFKYITYFDYKDKKNLKKKYHFLILGFENIDNYKLYFESVTEREIIVNKNKEFNIENSKKILNEFVCISADYLSEYIFLNKKDKQVYICYLVRKENFYEAHWIKTECQFDEFIDKLYCEELKELYK